MKEEKERIITIEVSEEEALQFKDKLVEAVNLKQLLQDPLEGWNYLGGLWRAKEGFFKTVNPEDRGHCFENKASGLCIGFQADNLPDAENKLIDMLNAGNSCKALKQAELMEKQING